MELNDLEKKVLAMLFSMGSTVIEAQDGYIEIDNESFSRNDLFNLACKLGIEDLY